MNFRRAACLLTASVAIGQVCSTDLAIAQSGAKPRQAIVLMPDEAVLGTGTVGRIDVLANDKLPPNGEGARIEVIAQPQCGEVTVRAGALDYSTLDGCEGPQVFYYGVAGSPAFAEVTVLVQRLPSEGAPQATFGMAVIERVPQADRRAASEIADSAPMKPVNAALVASSIASPVAAPPLAAQVFTAVALRPGDQAVGHDQDTASGGAQRVAAGPCSADVAVTTQMRPAALTEVAVSAPCHAGSAATLHYGDLKLGLAIDSRGSGSIVVPGIEPKMPASLEFADGAAHAVELRFSGFTQVDRLAVAWEAPVAYALNALEFGAVRGSGGHLDPALNPRSHDDVRRSGGGFLMTYAPVNGVGQTVQVYTHLAKPGSKVGVVRLMLDHAAGGPGACDPVAGSTPEILVMVSNRGLLKQAMRHRAASLGCGSAALEPIRLGDLVGNVVIR